MICMLLSWFFIYIVHSFPTAAIDFFICDAGSSFPQKVSTVEAADWRYIFTCHSPLKLILM